MPVSGYVFKEINRGSPLMGNFEQLISVGLPIQARWWINKNVEGKDVIRLYITGFTPALTAFLQQWDLYNPDTCLLYTSPSPRD